LKSTYCNYRNNWYGVREGYSRKKNLAWGWGRYILEKLGMGYRRVIAEKQT